MFHVNIDLCSCKYAHYNAFTYVIDIVMRPGNGNSECHVEQNIPTIVRCRHTAVALLIAGAVVLIVRPCVPANILCIEHDDIPSSLSHVNVNL